MATYNREDLRPRNPTPILPGKIRDKLLELLGLVDLPEYIDYASSTPREEDDIRFTNLSFANSLGETVPAILMEPMKNREEFLPGVVCIDGTNGSAERMAKDQFYMGNHDVGPLFGWARELTKRGYVTLAITPKGSVERRKDEKTWNIENMRLVPFGITQMGLIVEEALRGVRLLGAQDRVRDNNVGLTGMSLGGNAAWYAMACAPWLKAAVPICGGVGQMASVVWEGDQYRHSAYYYIPHMLRYFDHPEVVANCIAPRPFMIIAPTSDEDMPRSGVDELIRVVAPVYCEAGQTNQFRVYQPAGNHCFRTEYFEWMVDWCDQHLKSIP